MQFRIILFKRWIVLSDIILEDTVGYVYSIVSFHSFRLLVHSECCRHVIACYELMTIIAKPFSV